MNYNNLLIDQEDKREENEILQTIFNCIDSKESFLYDTGAGSGKTYALKEALVYIIRNYGKNYKKHNQNILCITYTNVAVKEIKERLGNTSGVLMESVLEGMAEYYSKELSQKTKRGMKETVLKGRWTGGYLPYGYDIAEHKFVINEFEANIIRNIYKDFIDGVKIKDIVQDLNGKGIKNKLGKPFSSNYVSRILRNERYIGKLSKTYESDEKSPTNNR